MSVNDALGGALSLLTQLGLVDIIKAAFVIYLGALFVSMIRKLRD